MSVASLLGVYRVDTGGHRSIIVKFFPDGIHQTDLGNYLEIICETDVNAVHFPVDRCNVAIAVFGDDLNETHLQRWQTNAFKKPLGVCYPTLEILGMCKGIYIAGVPDGVSDEHLQLYFENERSGGIEGCVANVEQVDTGREKHAIIKLSNEEAMGSILSRPNHQLKGTTVEIGPYFPSIHRYILESLKSRVIYKEAVSTALADDATFEGIVPLQSEQCSIPREFTSSPIADATLPSARDGHTDYNTNDRTADVGPLTRTDSGILVTSENNKNVIANPEPVPNVAAVKPILRHEHVNGALVDINGTEQSKSPGRNEPYPEWDYEEIIHMSSLKISMLILYRFNTKHETQGVKITLNEQEETVTFHAMSFDELKAVKIDMFECLDTVDSKTKKLSDSQFKFLSRDQCQKYLKSSSEMRNMRIVFEMNKQKPEILCHSFSDTEADRGIQFLEVEIRKITIHLKPGQEKCLYSSAWSTLKNLLDINLTTVYHSEQHQSVQIESFIESKAKEAEQKITQYLKNNMPKKAGTVTLEAAKARCFQSCFEDKVRRDIQQGNGTFDVVELSKDPLKLQISVEGEKSVTDELAKVVKKIWHENVDFSKISSGAADTWLIMKGLSGQTGKEFFCSFEQRHKCFIEVSENGEFSTPSACVTVEDVCDSTHEMDALGTALSDQIEEPQEATSVSLGASALSLEKSEKIEFDHQENRKRKGRRFSQCQTGMGEEEEINAALQLSMQTECPCDKGADSRPVGIVRPDNRSDDNPGEAEDDHMIFPTKCETMNKINFGPSLPIQTAADDTTGYDEYHQQEAAPLQAKFRCISMSRTTIKLAQGQITKQHADVLVNIISPSQKPFDGAIAKSFLETGGQELFKLYEENASSTRDLVVVTGPGRLKCSAVFHVRLKKDVQHKHMIKQTMSEVFNECRSWGCKSVAFPPLGVGRMFRYPPADVANRMLTETQQLLETGKFKMKEVTIVVYDDETYSTFDTAFQSIASQSTENISSRERFPLGVKQHNPFSAHSPGQPRMSTAKKQQTSSLGRATKASPHHNHASSSSANRSNPDHGARSSSSNWSHQVRGAHSSQATHEPPSASANRSYPDHGARSSSSNWSHQVRGAHSSQATHGPPSSSEESPNKKDKNASSNRNVPAHTKHNIQHSRYPSDTPAAHLKVKVFAENKEECVNARNVLSKAIKGEFLHEETVYKKQKISEEAKRNIVKIIIANDIKSFKENNKYILRGQERRVRKVYANILNILLAENDKLDVKRKQKSTTKRGTREFVKFMIDDEPEVPSYWKNYKQGKTLMSLVTSLKQLVKGRKYEKVELDRNGPEFCSIVKMVNATFTSGLVGQGQDAAGLDALSYSQLFVTKVERVENLDLYETFTRHRQKLYRQLYSSREIRFPKLTDIPNCTGEIKTHRYVHPALDHDIHPEINEYLLFHGTKDENVKIICDTGLDPRLGSGNAMFGQGIYGAECSSKADQYADDKDSRTVGKGFPKTMFLIRMVLGHSFLCTHPNPHKYRRPPCTTCQRDDCRNARHTGGKFGHCYDSVVGDNKKLFRECVVYDSTLCYPEYLITYERH